MPIQFTPQLLRRWSGIYGDPAEDQFARQQQVKEQDFLREIEQQNNRYNWEQILRAEQQASEQTALERKLAHDTAKMEFDAGHQEKLANMGFGAQDARDQRLADFDIARDERRFGQSSELQQQQLSQRAAEQELQRLSEMERLQYSTDAQGKRDLTERDTRYGLARYQSEQMRFQEDMRAQGDFERQMAEGLRTGKLHYTPAQKQQVAKWQNALFQVEQDDTLDDDQKRQAAMQLQRRIRGIIPVQVPNDEQPVSPDEAFAKVSTVHPDYGLFVSDGKGGWHQAKLPETKSKTGEGGLEKTMIANEQKQAALFQKWKKDRADYAFKLASATTPGKSADGKTMTNVPLYTPQQQKAMVEAHFGKVLSAQPDFQPILETSGSEYEQWEAGPGKKVFGDNIEAKIQALVEQASNPNAVTTAPPPPPLVREQPASALRSGANVTQGPMTPEDRDAPDWESAPGVPQPTAASPPPVQLQQDFVSKAIQAARNGDRSAQQMLTRRGIRWQQ